MSMISTTAAAIGSLLISTAALAWGGPYGLDDETDADMYYIVSDIDKAGWGTKEAQMLVTRRCHEEDEYSVVMAIHDDPWPVVKFSPVKVEWSNDPDYMSTEKRGWYGAVYSPELGVLYFEDTEAMLNRIRKHSVASVTVRWDKEGDYTFRFSLRGSASAMDRLQAKC